ncbi:MAG: hypothetical protein JXB10_09710 [Pirellulales bacterium]|nr:hypothetical protein [Pirellulales bacterium]
MADVLVSFQPSTKGHSASPVGLGSVGITDAQGRFQLKVVASDQGGTVVGRHVVRLTAKALRQEPTDMATPAVKNPLPPQSLDGSLSFEVPPGGTDQANFNLE